MRFVDLAEIAQGLAGINDVERCAPAEDLRIGCSHTNIGNTKGVRKFLGLLIILILDTYICNTLCMLL